MNVAETERERLARLEAEMREVLGSHGRPGRLENVEHDTRTNRTWMLLAIGGLYVLQILGANGVLSFFHSSPK